MPADYARKFLFSAIFNRKIAIFAATKIVRKKKEIAYERRELLYTITYTKALAFCVSIRIRKILKQHQQKVMSAHGRGVTLFVLWVFPEP